MSNPADDVDVPPEFQGLPKNMQQLIAYMGFPDFEKMEEDEQRVFNLAKEGKCMTCESPLGTDANFIVSRFGIVAGYCSGVCHSDMATLGFLQEQHQDIMDQVNFRSGGGDDADEDA